MRFPDTESKLSHEDDTREILSCAMEVSNLLGHGLHEKSYENALVIEFQLREIQFQQQPSFEIHYKDAKVGEFIPDLIVNGRVVVDTKTIDRIGDHEIGQMLNYLKITGLKVGLIINFKFARLTWKRVVL
jgi:GxxExxY protein